MKIDLSTWGLSNQRLVLLFVIILTLGGVVAYFRMPKLEDPEIVVRQAVVVGIYPGASAHQVELELTTPLERIPLKRPTTSSIHRVTAMLTCV